MTVVHIADVAAELAAPFELLLNIHVFITGKAVTVYRCLKTHQAVPDDIIAWLFLAG